MRPDDPAAPDEPAELLTQLATITTVLDVEVPAPILAKVLAVWTQLFGMVGFELTGQFAGALEPADTFVSYTIERMADFVGLAGERRNGG